MAMPEITYPSNVVTAVVEERRYQDGKFGNIQKTPHTIGEWILLIEAELAEAKEALIKGGAGRDSVRSEIVQVAALAVACLEQHGTNDTHEGRQV